MNIFIRIYKRLFRKKFTKTRVGKVILFALLLNLIFGILFYFAERGAQPDLTLLDAIWWAMVTMTTVGYGDFYAQTSIGRFLISYPCMLVGIGIIGYLVGVVAENMLDRFSKKRRGLMDIKLTGHLIICNFPNIEKIKRLMDEIKRSHDYKECKFVLITDSIDELPDELQKLDVQFVQGSPLKEETLHKANITKCKGVFILARNPGEPKSDSDTFTTGAIIEMIERELKKPIKVIVELVSKDNLKMMQRSRVDGIVSADGIMDGLIVQEFLYPGVHDIVHQIISNAVGSQFYIFDTKLQGQKISDIQIAVLEHPANLQVIGINRNGKSILNPSKNEIIQKDDRLIMLADKRDDIEAIEKEILNKSK
ncbi:MAG: ion channel [Calditrichaceae bacterium]